MLEFEHLIFAFTDLSWIYWTQKNSFVFDFWRNRFRKHDDEIERIEIEISTERWYVSLRKTCCLWLCDVWSSSLSLWNMMYKFFTNKHEDESRAEKVNKSWERVQADESWREILVDESQDEEVHHESCKMQDDLERKTETFWVSVQREFQADE